MEQQELNLTGAERRPPLAPSPELNRDVSVAWARDSILFSSCNEASASELRAFGELDGKHVLAITAGGGRVLNLLLARPELIWAVDLNPAQNHLLELKIAGMHALDHAEYLAFLGVRPATDRLLTYAALREQLSAGAREFFDRRSELLEAGVLFQGKLERYLHSLSRVLRLVRPLGVKRLFSFDDIEAQRQFMRVFDTPFFRAIAETACRRSVLRAFSGDPGFYKYVPEDVLLHREIYGGMLLHFNACLARDNPLMQYVFFGRIVHEEALPIYLNATTYPHVKAALANTRIVQRTSTVQAALAEIGPQAIDAFSLSDISSYLDDIAHGQLFSAVLTSARDSAKIVSRSNIHHRALSAEQARRVRRNHALERELAISDHSCVHKFLVGEVL